MKGWSLHLRAVVLVLCVAHLGYFCLQVGMRVGYPLDLEWMESGALHQAQRLLSGASMYPEPSSEFVPHLYTPGYSVLLGILGLVFPLGFGLARAVSILANLATIAAMVRMVHREGKPRLHALIAVALYVGSYAFCYRFMDIARPDAVMVACYMWGLYFLRAGWGHPRNVVLAGVLMSAAYWVKQSAFTLIVGSGLAALWVVPRLLWIYVLTIGALSGLGTLVFHLTTGGRFWYYVFELHQTHAFNMARLRHKSWAMMLHTWPMVAILLGRWLYRASKPMLWAQRRLDPAQKRWAAMRKSANTGPIFWWIMLACSCLAGAISYSTQWAEPNAFLPACAVMSVLVGVLLSTQGAIQWVELGLVGGQLGFLLLTEPDYLVLQREGIAAILRSYPLKDYGRGLAGPAHREGAKALATKLHALSAGEGIEDGWGAWHRGHLLALQHPWWSMRNGGPAQVASMGINDLDTDARNKVQEQMAARIEDGEFEAIWVEGALSRWQAGAMGSKYVLAKRYRGEERVLPLSGWMSLAGTAGGYHRDQLLYLAARPVPLPEGCRRLADFEDATAQGLETIAGNLVPGPTPTRVGSKLAFEGGAGQYAWLSVSARRALSGQGRARMKLEVPPGRYELRLGVGWLGKTGSKGLAMWMEQSTTKRKIDLPKQAGMMQQLVVPIDRAGPWLLVVEDISGRAALVLDEIWLCEQGVQVQVGD